MNRLEQHLESKDFIQYYKENVEFSTIYNRVELNLYFIIELTLRKILEEEFEVTNISTWKYHESNKTRIKTNFPDLVILSKDKTGYDEICMVEAKYLPFKSDYHLDRHESQVRSQQESSKIYYSILTNGLEWRFYNLNHVEVIVLGDYKNDVIEWSHDFNQRWIKLIKQIADFVEQSNKDKILI